MEEVQLEQNVEIRQVTTTFSGENSLGVTGRDLYQDSLVVGFNETVDLSIFEINDLLKYRAVSRKFRDRVNKALYFQLYVFTQVLLLKHISEFPRPTFCDLLQNSNPFLAGLLDAYTHNQAKGYIIKNQKRFIQILLRSLLFSPETTCRIVQLCDDVGLTRKDLTEVNDYEIGVFEFLTQPIRDFSKEREDYFLTCVGNLSEDDYSSQNCDKLRLSIQATFSVLRNSRSLCSLTTYRNLAGADLREVNSSEIKISQSRNLFGILNFWAKPSALQVNFRGANLRGANLTGMILPQINLRGANLRGAHLYRADLMGAILNNANLTGANLRDTKLTDAKFIRANLKTAHIAATTARNTDFTEANFHGTDFSVLTIMHANFGRTDISNSPCLINQVILMMLYHEGDFEKEAQKRPLQISSLIFGMTDTDNYNFIVGKGSLAVIKYNKLAKIWLENVLKNITLDDFIWIVRNILSTQGNVFYDQVMRPHVYPKNTWIYPETVKLIAEAYIKLCNSKWVLDKKTVKHAIQIKDEIIYQLKNVFVRDCIPVDDLIKKLQETQLKVTDEGVKETSAVVILADINNNNNISTNREAAHKTQAEPVKPVADEHGNPVEAVPAEQFISACGSLSFWKNPTGLQKFGMGTSIFSGAVLAASGIVSLTSLKAMTVGAVLSNFVNLSTAVAAMTVPHALLIIGAVLLATAVFMYAAGSIAKYCARPQPVYSIN